MLFTRYPRSGAAKTRLIPALGEDGAAQLHRELTERALMHAKRFDAAETEVWYTGADEAAMSSWLGPEQRFRAQNEGDLGRRMSAAFETAMREGAARAVIAGTDCPDLGPETYAAAFDALRSNDLVLGPAIDGGYYLIGLRRDAWPRAAALFDGIPWSTEHVLARTLEESQRLGLSHALTAPLADIDSPDDLAIWRRINNRGGAGTASLSVVIPTFNAGAGFEATLRSATAESGAEIIVADAGSTDGTRELARQFGARVIQAPRGRARQMNVASAHASGETLLFLHSDTLLPGGYVDEVHRTLARPGVVAGAFSFATDYAANSMRVVEASTNFRARILQLPYGDQGIFIRTADFRRLGGFRDLPIMDDFDFVIRARKLGRVACAGSAAVTSGRRWRELGVWRTMIRNQTVVAMYYAGIDTERIARYYRRGVKT